jgi:hypothetical protein
MQIYCKKIHKFKIKNYEKQKSSREEDCLMAHFYFSLVYTTQAAPY